MARKAYWHCQHCFEIVCILLVVGIFSFMIVSYNKLEQEKQSLESELESMKDEHGNSSMARALLLDNLSLMYDNDNITLPEFVVEDVNGNKLNVKSLFHENRYKLVFFFSYLHCETCISSSLNSIAKATQKITPDNVIIIGEFPNKRAMQAYLFGHSFELPMYFKNDSVNLGVLEEENMPFLCMMKKDMRINHMLIPIKEIPNQLNRYLESMKGRYFLKDKNG